MMDDVLIKKLVPRIPQRTHINVEILTLLQHARDCAFLQVVDTQVGEATYETIQTKTEKMLCNNHIDYREFISIETDNIIIGIDSDTIDEAAINKAVSLLNEVTDFSEGIQYIGKCTFN